MIFKPYRVLQSLSFIGLVSLLGCSPPPGGDIEPPHAPGDIQLESKALSLATVVFDYEMQSRSTSNGEELAEHRNQFPVALKGCGSSTTSNVIRTWIWDVSVAPNSNVKPLVQPIHITSSTCTTTTWLPQGEYQVKLTVSDGQSALGTLVSPMILTDYVIVSMGDSVASGEGVPADLWERKLWQHRRCHESFRSGPRLAAKAIDDADPHSSVTFISTACSGAGITEGILGEYDGAEKTSFEHGPLPSQIDQLIGGLWNLLKGRKIDALMVNIGANDIGFGDVVRLCGYPWSGNQFTRATTFSDWWNSKTFPGDCNKFQPLLNKVRSGLASLPQKYKDLNDAIRDRLKVNPRSVFITQYQDPTWGDNRADGSPVSCDKMIFKDAGLNDLDGKINATEVTWARNDVVIPLNQAVSTAAATWGWNLVTGIPESFQGHGYCASESNRWIRTYTESFATQQNEMGSMHPNLKGHQLYASKLAAAITPFIGGPKLVSAQSNDVHPAFPTQNALDSNPATFYSSGIFPSAKNDRSTFFSASLSPGPMDVNQLLLTARMIDGVVNSFPANYDVFVTSPDNLSWIHVGDFSNQPGPDGVARIAIGNWSTQSVFITPKTLGPDIHGNYYFQLADARLVNLRETDTKMASAFSNDVHPAYPSSNAIDESRATFYSSGLFSTSDNNRGAFLQSKMASLANVNTVELTARTINGFVNSFPQTYSISVWSRDGTHLVSVGDFSTQPGSDGIARVFIGNRTSNGVVITPKSLSPDIGGSFYFQMANIRLIDSLEGKFVSATSNFEDPMYPAAGAIDEVGQRPFVSSSATFGDNRLGLFFAAWLAGPTTVNELTLTAHSIDKVNVDMFPAAYSIWVTSPDNSHWQWVGNFTSQPEWTGKFKVRIPLGLRVTQGVYIRPTQFELNPPRHRLALSNVRLGMANIAEWIAKPVN